MTAYLISLLSLATIMTIPLAFYLRLKHDLKTRMYFAIAIAITATLGSLYFSEVAHFTPCRLCWLQRILMYGIALMGIVALFQDKIKNIKLHVIRPYITTFAVVGLPISLYHVLLEQKPSLESTSCQATVPCSAPYFIEYGFITLAVMAATAFVSILIITIGKGEKDES